MFVPCRLVRRGLHCCIKRRSRARRWVDVHNSPRNSQLCIPSPPISGTSDLAESIVYGFFEAIPRHLPTDGHKQSWCKRGAGREEDGDFDLDFDSDSVSCTSETNPASGGHLHSGVEGVVRVWKGGHIRQLSARTKVPRTDPLIAPNNTVQYSTDHNLVCQTLSTQ